MLRRWKTLSSKTLYKNPWWTYRVNTFQIPNGVSGEYHYVHTEGASLVVPILDDGRLILVNQYRYLCDRESIEFPCGGVKLGHSYDEMAQKELEEETGFRSDTLHKVGEFDPYNGVTDEFCAVFIARGLHRTQAKPDATEEFEVVECSPDKLENLIRERRIWDGMTLAAWAMVKEKVK
jgi:8-oxo-dGTP pyrophosphatase MutT (NUDIX family)